jgi:hypothetical protein
MVIFHSYVSLPEGKVKVLLVTLELDQHWLHAKKNRRWRLDTDVRCQEKIGAEGGDGVGAKF